MLMNKKGQMGPQGLEDLPMAIMAFIVAIAAIIIYLDIASAHLSEANMADMHNTGKRLVETFSSEVFNSDISRFYGGRVLDAKLIQVYYDKNSTLSGIVGSVEYKYWARIETELDSWEFGLDPPKRALMYGDTVTILSDGLLYNGRITLKIWSK